MNITLLSNTFAASQPWNGTAVLSGINIFESCITSIESNCTIQPATVPGAHPYPCLTPEVLLNQVKPEKYVYIIINMIAFRLNDMS